MIMRNLGSGSMLPADCSRPAYCLAMDNPSCPHLLIQDGVRFVETQTAQPGERPLLVAATGWKSRKRRGP